MKLNSLRTIGFEITGRCNFNCVHCFLGCKTERYLSKDFILSILDEIGDQFHTVYLTGGEPFLHPDFSGIYESIRSRGFLIDLLTNGSLIDDSIWRLLKNSMPHRMEISLYGMTEKTNRRVTGVAGSFDTVKSNIIKLSTMCKGFSVKYNLLSLNYHELNEFVNFCQTYDIQFSISARIIPDVFGSPNTAQYRLEPQTAVAVLESLGFALKTVKKEQHHYDAGDSIFIDSNKILRECLVCKTDCDLKIDQGYHDLRPMCSAVNRIRSFCNNAADQSCPGWILPQDRKQVNIDRAAIYDHVNHL